LTNFGVVNYFLLWRQGNGNILEIVYCYCYCCCYYYYYYYYYYYHHHHHYFSAVSTLTTGWMSGVRFPVTSGNFFFATKSRQALGPTQPPTQRKQGVKRPRREAGHSPPSSDEVKNAWIYTYNYPYIFTLWCLSKQGRAILCYYFLTSLKKIPTLDPSLVLVVIKSIY
jgi:hypothetical protein